MTVTHGAAPLVDAEPPTRWARWPLANAGAGLAGLIASTPYVAPDERAGVATALLCATAVAMLLAAALWRCHVEPRTRQSVASGVVPLGLLASAAALPVATVGAVAAWSGVLAAALAIAWMGLRERTVWRPLAVVSGLGVPLVVLAPAVGGPLWLLVTGLGLALGRSTISR